MHGLDPVVFLNICRMFYDTHYTLFQSIPSASLQMETVQKITSLVITLGLSSGGLDLLRAATFPGHDLLKLSPVQISPGTTHALLPLLTCSEA